jgi:hypothetical protein
MPFINNFWEINLQKKGSFCSQNRKYWKLTLIGSSETMSLLTPQSGIQERRFCDERVWIGDKVKNV